MQIHANYQNVRNYFNENNWHEILNTQLTEDELAILGNEKPEKEAGPVSNLPVAYKQVSEDIDPTKKTIVISHTEDLPSFLEEFCKYLDIYIQNLPGETKDKYNIIVAVSTSAEDMLRALKKLKQIIGEGFNQAKFLFLNDMVINRRKTFEVERSDRGGENIIKIARRFIGDNAFIKTLIQSQGRSNQQYTDCEYNPYTWNDDESVQNAVAEITRLFQKNKVPWLEGKLLSCEGKVNGISIPLEAFLKSLHQEENYSNRTG